MNSTQSHVDQLITSDCLLGEPFPREPGDSMSTYGYRVYPVRPEFDPGEGNRVVYEVEPGGSTELTIINGDVNFTVTGIGGEGEAVVWEPDGQRRIYDLAHGIGQVSLGKGVIYQYHHRGGETPFYLLDHCLPRAFEPADETPLEIIESLIDLQEGDRFALHSPREPGQAELGGAWLLDIEDAHDTTEVNRRSLGMSRFRPTLPHWHGRITRVGQTESLPIKVQVAANGRHQLRHRHPDASSEGTLPSLAMQPNTTIFRRIRA